MFSPHLQLFTHSQFLQCLHHTRSHCILEVIPQVLVSIVAQLYNDVHRQHGDHSRSTLLGSVNDSTECRSAEAKWKSATSPQDGVLDIPSSQVPRSDGAQQTVPSIVRALTTAPLIDGGDVVIHQQRVRGHQRTLNELLTQFNCRHGVEKLQPSACLSERVVHQRSLKDWNRGHGGGARSTKGPSLYMLRPE